MILLFLKSAWGVLKLIPWQVYAVIAAGIAIYGYGLNEHHLGYKEAKAEDAKVAEAVKAKYDIEVAAIKAKQQEVITHEVIVYRDRVKIVKEKGDEIIKEVQVLVPLNSPLLAGGVRVAHDAAALGNLPDDPEGAARTAAPIETAALLTTVAENYQSCSAEREKLIALQTIVSKLGEP